MKLILTGGGVDENAIDAFSMFAKLTKKGKILYIPLADDEMGLEENFTWFKGQMKPYNFSKIEIVKDASEITMEKINSADGIFIGGGNAFQLLYLLKSCKAFENIKKAIKNDKPVLGLSAGTTIFGKDINSCLYDDLKIIANDKNKIGLTNTKGYNLIENCSFFVHYKLKDYQFEATEQKVNRILNLGCNVICLPEETNLFVTENEITVFGKKPAEFVTPNYREIVKPNEKITFDLSINL